MNKVPFWCKLKCWKNLVKNEQKILSKMTKVLFRCFRLWPDPLLNGCRVLGCFYTFHLQPGYKWLYDYIYTTRSTFNQDTNYLTQIYKSCVANLGHPWGRLLCDHPETEGFYCHLIAYLHQPFLILSSPWDFVPSFLISSNFQYHHVIILVLSSQHIVILAWDGAQGRLGQFAELTARQAASTQASGWIWHLRYCIWQ